MINETKEIVKSLVKKGFTEEDAKLMADNVKNREDVCDKIAAQNNKSNVLLGLFMWHDSTQGTLFWTEKFQALVGQEFSKEFQGE